MIRTALAAVVLSLVSWSAAAESLTIVSSLPRTGAAPTRRPHR